MNNQTILRLALAAALATTAHAQFNLDIWNVQTAEGRIASPPPPPLTPGDVTDSSSSSSIGTNAFGANAFGANAFGANGFGANAFATNGFGANGFGANGFGSNGFGSNGFGANGFGANAFGANGFGSNGFGSNGFGANGFGANGFGSNGFGSNAFGSNGFGSNGFGANAFGANGFGANGIDANGFGSNGFGSNGFGSNGFGANGFGANSVGINGFGSNGLGPSGFGANGFGANGFGANGFGANGFGSNGFGSNNVILPNGLSPEGKKASELDAGYTIANMGINPAAQGPGGRTPQRGFGDRGWGGNGLGKNEFMGYGSWDKGFALGPLGFHGVSMHGLPRDAAGQLDENALLDLTPDNVSLTGVALTGLALLALPHSHLAAGCNVMQRVAAKTILDALKVCVLSKGCSPYVAQKADYNHNFTDTTATMSPALTKRVEAFEKLHQHVADGTAGGHDGVDASGVGKNGFKAAAADKLTNFVGPDGFSPVGFGEHNGWSSNGIGGTGVGAAAVGYNPAKFGGNFSGSNNNWASWYCKTPNVFWLANDTNIPEKTASGDLQASDFYGRRLAFGANGFGANGFGSNGFGSNGFGSNGFGSNGFGSNGFGSNGFGSNGFGANAFGSNGFGANGFGANGFGSNGFGANGFGANGFGSNGATAQRGFQVNAFGANGFGANGFGSNGFGANGFGANGFGANGFGANTIGTNGFGSNGFGANVWGTYTALPTYFTTQNLERVDGGIGLKGMSADAAPAFYADSISRGSFSHHAWGPVGALCSDGASDDPDAPSANCSDPLEIFGELDEGGADEICDLGRAQASFTPMGSTSHLHGGCNFPVYHCEHDNLYQLKRRRLEDVHDKQQQVLDELLERRRLSIPAADYSFLLNRPSFQQMDPEAEAKSKSNSAFAPNAFGANGFGANGFGSNAFGSNGFGANGFGANGFGANGFGANGFGANGFGANGFGANGFGANGFGANTVNSEGVNAMGAGPYGIGADGYNTKAAKGPDGNIAPNALFAPGPNYERSQIYNMMAMAGIGDFQYNTYNGFNQMAMPKNGFGVGSYAAASGHGPAALGNMGQGADGFGPTVNSLGAGSSHMGPHGAGEGSAGPNNVPTTIGLKGYGTVETADALLGTDATGTALFGGAGIRADTLKSGSAPGFAGDAATSHPEVAAAYAGADVKGFMNILESGAYAFGPGGHAGFMYGQYGFGAELANISKVDGMAAWENATFTPWGIGNLDTLGLGWTGTNAYAGANYATMCGDPHLNLPNGGMADFRGKEATYYNFLSAKNFSLNVKTEPTTFKMRNLTVHGTFITETHFALRTRDDTFLNVSFWAAELNKHQWGWRMVNGTCDGRAFVKGPHTTLECANLKVGVEHSSMVVLTDEWEVTVSGQPVYDWVAGPINRLDISYEPRVDLNRLAVSPHGIVGQAFDGDTRPRMGRIDKYPPTDVPGKEFTTTAMAEGAIEGAAADYEAASPYSTDFKYTRFDHGPRPKATAAGRPTASAVM